MKKISKREQRKIMIDILKYFDKKCRENNVKYSLIGGSLIGAIRHKNIIPWDDDIDIILTRDNYLKIIDVLKKDHNSKYYLLINDICKDYHFPFPKLVNKETLVVEPLLPNQINNYGIYIDIFCYNNVSDDERKRKRSVKRLKFINGLISRKKINIKRFGLKKSIVWMIRNILSTVIGNKLLIRIAEKICNEYLQQKTEYVVSNWPIYDISKELQLSKNTIEYIDVEFGDMKAMVFKNYDAILRTTFGNYMQLPPKNERISHGLEAYWRNENEKTK